MIQTFLLFAPGFVALSWLLIHPLLARRNGAFWQFSAVLLVLSAIIISDSCYASPRVSYSVHARLSVVFQFVTPSLVPLLMIYFNKLSSRYNPNLNSMGWLLIAGALFAAGLITYQVVGQNNMEHFIEVCYKEGFEAVVRFRGTVYFYFFLWDVVAFNLVIVVEYLVLIFYVIHLSRRENYRFSDIWAFFFRGGRIPPIELEMYFILPLMLLMSFRSLLLKDFIDTHVWLSIIGAVIIAFLVFGFCYVALFGSAKDISIDDMRNAFRYNCPQDKLPQAENASQEVTQTSFVSSTDIFSESRSYPEDEDLRLRFQRLMQEERLFLSQGLSLSDVADRLSSNKTYVSKLVNTTYDMGFPELLNTLRVEYSQNYILNHRNARQDEIARSCGFQSASSFNMIFKKVTGVTPKVWLAGTLR